jgi:hypothetical protein
VVTEAETTASLLGNGELVTGNHLDLDTESHGVVDGLLGVGSRGVEDGKETDELEAAALRVLLLAQNVFVSHGESTETTAGKLLDVGLELVLEFRGLVAGAELDDDTSHTLGGARELAIGRVAVGDLGTLVNGVEGLEVEELNAGAGRLGVREGADDTAVNGVLVLGTGSVGSEEADALDIPVRVALDVPCRW